ncbi:hypothetical protein SLEP1_g52053 [Rubroshorea leprosula]|uniref:Uncharacterized protein n=1 Tax=Rubroshorea leprosula TaxID=152421 RepID=A0AAV5M568_9ROSI|nr:hypothetical protein SLEP1_g52053 [Rubroshorea leprosula]
MEVASISTDEGTLSASQNHLNFTSLGFLFYYESQLLRSICSKSINTHPILPQPLFLPRHLACSIPTGRRNRVRKGNTVLGFFFFLNFYYFPSAITIVGA